LKKNIILDIDKPFESFRSSLDITLAGSFLLGLDMGMTCKCKNREEGFAWVKRNFGHHDFLIKPIERYMADPGQALSYKIGALKIRELRDKYSRQLGSKFNIGEFHKKILQSGCLPLSVMEEMMDKWAEKLTVDN